MENKNFIPKSGATFNEWQQTLVNYAGNRLPDWNIPEEDFTELTRLQADFTAKSTMADNPATRTPAITTAKIEARKAYKKYIRRFIKKHLICNHKVSDEDRRNMQLPARDTTPDTTETASAPADEIDVWSKLIFRYLSNLC
jgi:hypothetical protein